MPDPTQSDAEVLAAMTPEQRALFDQSMAARAGWKVVADRQVAEKQGDKNA